MDVDADLDAWLEYTLGTAMARTVRGLQGRRGRRLDELPDARAEHPGSRSGTPGINPSTWDTGANIEAKYLLLRHAFEALGCRPVEFKTDAKNERARAALAAIPAEFEGIHRKHMVVRGGERRDSAWYAVIDDDWPEVKAALERRLATKR